MSEWNTTVIGRYVELTNGFAFPSTGFTEGEGMPLIRIRDLNRRDTEVNFRGRYTERYVVKKGNLLIGMDGDFLTIRWKGNNALLNQRVCKLVTKDRERLVQDFLFYRIIEEIAAIHRITAATTVKHLSSKDILGIEIKLPSKPEQTKIAEILSTVDQAIEQTEALIAKQQRIKTGLIQDLLTRGIDEHGYLRPSHDEAPELYQESELGWIPKEWRLTTVGSILSGIDAGKSPECPDKPTPAGEWGVLKVSAVQPSGFRSSENKIIENPRFVNPSYEVKDGDLLISRANTYELVGVVCLVRNPQARLLLSDKTLRLRCNPGRIITPFLFQILQQHFVRRQIEINATGTSGSMKNISQPGIRGLRIYSPS